jgi:6-phosphogluconolactonase
MFMRKILIVAAILLTASIAVQAQNPLYYLLVGTYTGAGKGEGIYVYKFNPNKNIATQVSVIAAENPSYLAISKDNKYVYSVNENHDDKGAVSAFALDRKKGELTLLNKQPSGGDDPAYISVDSTGKNVLVANYSGGNLSVLKTNADGSLQPAAQTIAHQGYGTNVKRQEMPHVHSVVLSPDEKYMFAQDLGVDKVYSYHFDANAAQPLSDNDPATYDVPDGSGPRHLTFAPNGKFAYLINELSGKVTVYSYSSADGKLTQIQEIASDNTPGKEDKGSADIHITPNGKFLYTSNRASANDITIFKIQTDGQLVEAAHQKVGAHPRNFMIDPTGHFVLVANRDSNNIQIFVINKNYGLLEDTGVTITVPSPVCLKMVPIN